MKPVSVKAATIGVSLVGLVVLLAACSMGGSAPSQAAANSGSGSNNSNSVAAAPVTHSQTPGEPPAAASTIKDATSAATSGQHRVNAGENYAFNQFERPFSQDMQTYDPFLDIVQVDYSKDTTWAYFSMRMVGQDKNSSLPGVYGVELDVNQDGRGDFLVVVTSPKVTTWSSDGVKVFADQNHDVDKDLDPIA